MKSIKMFVFGLIVLVSCILFAVYVYIGTYIFPIAPYWITQLPPNPPKPVIDYGEFNFKITYSIEGVEKEVSNIIVCKFDGFEVRGVGDSKKRVWVENLKNAEGHEFFRFRDEDRVNEEMTYSSICIENIDKYKVILEVASAEWFLDEPEYNVIPNMPYIHVYDTTTRYYLDPDSKDSFLKKYDFEILEWHCDKPIKNTFK